MGKDGFGKNGPHLPYFIDYFFVKSPYLDHWFLDVTTHTHTLYSVCYIYMAFK